MWNHSRLLDSLSNLHLVERKLCFQKDSRRSAIFQLPRTSIIQMVVWVAGDHNGPSIFFNFGFSITYKMSWLWIYHQNLFGTCIKRKAISTFGQNYKTFWSFADHAPGGQQKVMMSTKKLIRQENKSRFPKLDVQLCGFNLKNVKKRNHQKIS